MIFNMLFKSQNLTSYHVISFVANLLTTLVLCSPSLVQQTLPTIITVSSLYQSCPCTIIGPCIIIAVYCTLWYDSNVRWRDGITKVAGQCF